MLNKICFYQVPPHLSSATQGSKFGSEFYTFTAPCQEQT